MNHKEKAEELIDRFIQETRNRFESKSMSYRRAKQCALISISNEYESNKELILNLQSSGVIESEKVYLFKIAQLINEEKLIKQEIEKL